MSGVFVEQQVQGLRECGIDVRVHLVDRGNGGMGCYFRMRGPLDAELRQYSPDLIHIMYGGVMAERLTHILKGWPTVVTFHGSDVLGENLSGMMRRLVSHFGVRCSRIAARRATEVIAVSRQLASTLSRTARCRRVHVIPCGIDLRRFRPMDPQACRRELGWDPDTFHVLFPANNGDPVKRPALARAAVECLARSGVKVEMHYLRGVNNCEVPTWINACHALLLTSLHEGSPTVVKESLACDLPVVSVMVGDVAERIEGIEGCHLADAEPEALAKALDRVRRRQDRVRGRESMKALSIEAIGRRVEAVYLSAQREARPSKVTGRPAVAVVGRQ